MYKVNFYTLPGGKSPIKDFIDASQKSLRKKILREMKYLAEFGLTRENPSLRKLTGTPLWEVRILGGGSTRIICVMAVGSRIVIVHIFKKKSSKTPSKEIDLAMKRGKSLTIDT